MIAPTNTIHLYANHNLATTRARTTPENTCRLDSCRFCALSRGGQDLFTEMYGTEPFLNVPGMPDSLMLMLDSFPIGVEGGHLLLAPVHHLPSLAHYRDTALLKNALARSTAILQAMFPDKWLFTFEHGPGEIDTQRVKCGGCHVDHAHGHILVLEPSVSFDYIRALTETSLENLGWDLVQQSQQSPEPFTQIQAFTGNLPYLQIGRIGPNENVAVTYKQTSTSQGIPSQLLRKLVATAEGRPQPSWWNWKIALRHKLTQRIDLYRQQALSFKHRFESFVAA